MHKSTHLNYEKIKKWKKPAVLLASVFLLLTVAVGGTLAFLITTSGSIQNIFTPSNVAIEVTEDTDTTPGVKNNVAIKNIGDTEVYIRAAVIVSWQNEKGEVYGRKPVTNINCQHSEGCTCDYKITWTKDGWQEGNDGFYYYLTPVAAGESTGELFTACSPIANRNPDGYCLAVEVIGSGIQSVPDNVVEEWSNSKVEVSVITGDDGKKNLNVIAKSGS